MITVKCPCGQTLAVPPNTPQFRCPKCNNTVTLGTTHRPGQSPQQQLSADAQSKVALLALLGRYPRLLIAKWFFLLAGVIAVFFGFLFGGHMLLNLPEQHWEFVLLTAAAVTFAGVSTGVTLILLSEVFPWLIDVESHLRSIRERSNKNQT